MINEINFRFTKTIYMICRVTLGFDHCYWSKHKQQQTDLCRIFFEKEQIFFCLPQQSVIVETRRNKIYNIFFVNKLPISSDESVSLRVTIFHVLSFSAAFRAEYR